MDAYLGVVLQVNDKEIALVPKTPINKISTMGLEAELPPGTEVHLGSIGGGVESVVQSFQKPGETLWKLPNPDTLPLQILKDGFNTLITAEITLNELSIKIPPKPTTGSAADKADDKTLASTEYAIGLYVSWPAPKKLIGNLSLVGFSVRFTSDSLISLPPAPTPAPTN
jgi:hypothetical protein